MFVLPTQNAKIFGTLHFKIIKYTAKKRGFFKKIKKNPPITSWSSQTLKPTSPFEINVPKISTSVDFRALCVL